MRKVGIEDTYFLFILDEKQFVIPVSYINQILALPQIVPLPDGPAYLKGAINLRQKSIPVMDLRLRLGFPDRAYNDRTCVIIVQVDARQIGLIVDSVREVLPIPAAQIQESNANRDQFNQNQRFLVGTGFIHGSVKHILDVAALCKDPSREAMLPEPQGVME